MWKAFSGFCDDLVLGVNCVLRGKPALSESGPGAGPAVDELIAEQAARPPEIRWPARFERRVGRLSIRMPVIGFDTFADFHPARGEADTLFVYHHGLSEFPHDGSASRILTKGELRERVDWIAIRGCHHDSAESVGRRLTHCHVAFARGLLSSIYTARALAEGLRGRYKHVVLGGMSMGGVISLLEGALGSEFDLLVPLMAGPDLEDVLLRSSFSRIVCRRYRARGSAEVCTSRFDITSRLALDGPPIRAVLASHDRLFRIDAQRAAYGRVRRAHLTIINAGHITGAIRFWTLAAAVERALAEELWAPATARTAAPAPALAVA